MYEYYVSTIRIRNHDMALYGRDGLRLSDARVGMKVFYRHPATNINNAENSGANLY